MGKHGMTATNRSRGGRDPIDPAKTAPPETSAPVRSGESVAGDALCRHAHSPAEHAGPRIGLLTLGPGCS